MFFVWSKVFYNFCWSEPEVLRMTKEKARMGMRRFPTAGEKKKLVHAAFLPMR